MGEPGGTNTLKIIHVKWFAFKKIQNRFIFNFITI
jgi:hypothetical protein